MEVELNLAISQIEEELVALGHGTPSQPKEGTTEWFRLRALGVGLSFLRDARGKGLGASSSATERHRRLWAKDAKEAVV